MNARHCAGRVLPCAFMFAMCFSGPLFAEPVLDRVARSGHVSIGYRDSSPPFSYLDQDRQPVGYSIDICLKIVEAVRQSLRRPVAVGLLTGSTRASVKAISPPTSSPTNIPTGSKARLRTINCSMISR